MLLCLAAKPKLFPFPGGRTVDTLEKSLVQVGAASSAAIAVRLDQNRVHSGGQLAGVQAQGAAATLDHGAGVQPAPRGRRRVPRTRTSRAAPSGAGSCR